MEFNEFRFVFVSLDYLAKMHKADSEVFFREDSAYERKPHLGIMINQDGKKYVIPLTSAKEKHKTWNDVTATNYIIYESINVEKVNVKSGDIVVDIKDKSLLEKMKISKEDYYKYRKRLISVLEIKKMFPVKEGVYRFAEFQVDNELSLEEVQRRILMQKEYRFCRKIKKQIVEKANRIYDKQMRTGKVLKFHCDYKKLEKACKDYKIP